MKRLLAPIIFLLPFVMLSTQSVSLENSFQFTTENALIDSQKLSDSALFDSLNLGKLGLARRAFDYAMLGYKALKAKGMLHNDDIITIADMTLPSSKKRLFVFDVKNYKLLFVTYVAHGKNTGVEKALYFSNEGISFFVK